MGPLYAAARVLGYVFRLTGRHRVATWLFLALAVLALLSYAMPGAHAEETTGPSPTDTTAPADPTTTPDPSPTDPTATPTDPAPTEAPATAACGTADAPCQVEVVGMTGSEVTVALSVLVMVSLVALIGSWGGRRG